MTVPRNFTQWFDREIERHAESARKLAADIHEESGWLLKDLTANGENARTWGTLAGKVAELTKELQAVDVLKALREQKRGFESVEADSEERLRAGSANGGLGPAAEPPPKPVAGKRLRKRP